MISKINFNGSNSSESISIESREVERKGRTVVIRNFEDGTSMDELEKKFREFGIVNKVTIMCDKLSGKPKAMAYVEFEEKNARNEALMLNGMFYKNNVIYVNKQSKEIPLTAGKKEKCYNNKMENYFEGDKNNFGPIRMRKKMRKKVEPY